MYRFNQLSEVSREFAAQDFIELLDYKIKDRLDDSVVLEIMQVLDNSDYLFTRNGKLISLSEAN